MDIYDLAKHLPEGVNWGDEITPMMLDEIISPLIESARRADRRAREECAEICRNRAKIAHAEYAYDEPDNIARTESSKCAKAIIETIPEDQP